MASNSTMASSWSSVDLIDAADVPEPEPPELYDLGSEVTLDALIDEYLHQLETSETPVIIVSPETYAHIVEQYYPPLQRISVVGPEGDYYGLKFYSGLIVVR